VRDELLLKLFFADQLPPEEVLALLRMMRARHESTRAGLEKTEPFAREMQHPLPYLVLRFGIEFHGWVAAWCERAERSLKRGVVTNV
jgi:hypothetical protein